MADGSGRVKAAQEGRQLVAVQPVDLPFSSPVRVWTGGFRFLPEVVQGP